MRENKYIKYDEMKLNWIQELQTSKESFYKGKQY